MSQSNQREIVETRARQIFTIAEHLLINYDPADYTIGSAFRYAYLILRKPSGFFRAFSEGGNLFIDAEEVASFIFGYSMEIEGPAQLLEMEAATIERHNSSVRDLDKNNGRSIQPSNVITLVPQGTGSYR